MFFVYSDCGVTESDREYCVRPIIIKDLFALIMLMSPFSIIHKSADDGFQLTRWYVQLDDADQVYDDTSGSL